MLQTMKNKSDTGVKHLWLLCSRIIWDDAYVKHCVYCVANTFIEYFFLKAYFQLKHSVGAKYYNCLLRLRYKKQSQLNLFAYSQF